MGRTETLEERERRHEENMRLRECETLVLKLRSEAEHLEEADPIIELKRLKRQELLELRSIAECLTDVDLSPELGRLEMKIKSLLDLIRNTFEDEHEEVICKPIKTCDHVDKILSEEK